MDRRRGISPRDFPGRSPGVQWPRGHVFLHDVALFDQLPENLPALLRLDAERDRFLIQVHDDEAEGVNARFREGVSPEFACFGAFHFDDVRPEPRQGLRIDGPRLELR